MESKDINNIMIKIKTSGDKKANIKESNKNAIPFKVRMINEPFDNPNVIGKKKRIQILEEIKQEILSKQICVKENARKK